MWQLRSRVFVRSVECRITPDATRQTCRGQCQRGMTESMPFFPPLQDPAILFESNHLLAVNKPPGWHSIPNSNKSADGMQQVHGINKCLLSHLKERKLGGGSDDRFLKPIHRIDQPCSGLMLWAKTTKAASRIQSAWSMSIRKTYLVVIQCRHDLSPPHCGGHRFTAIVYPPRRGTRGRITTNQWNTGWSVCAIPVNNGGHVQEKKPRDHDDGRVQQLVWETTLATTATKHGNLVLARISTSDGGRHVVRAVLAAHGFPIVGDLRYSDNSSKLLVLSDKSVALHAESLQMNPASTIPPKLQTVWPPSIGLLYAPPPSGWRVFLPESYAVVPPPHNGT